MAVLIALILKSQPPN